MNKDMVKQQILELLAENFQCNAHPDAVDANIIAEKIQLPLSATKEIIKCMKDKGIIESTLEGEYSIITRKGMDSLKQFDVSL